MASAIMGFSSPEEGGGRAGSGEGHLQERLCGEVGRYGWLIDHAVVCVLCELEFREECGH